MTAGMSAEVRLGFRILDL